MGRDTDSEPITTNVRGCARCGADHAAMVFAGLLNAVDEWRWWAPCPATGQPVLLRLANPEGVDECWHRDWRQNPGRFTGGAPRAEEG